MATNGNISAIIPNIPETTETSWDAPASQYYFSSVIYNIGQYFYGSFHFSTELLRFLTYHDIHLQNKYMNNQKIREVSRILSKVERA